MLVFDLLSIDGLLVLNLPIAAFALFVFPIAISGGETILLDCFGVFRALKSYMTVAATLWAFPVGLPQSRDLHGYAW